MRTLWAALAMGLGAAASLTGVANVLSAYWD
jgi:hypothetical protein